MENSEKVYQCDTCDKHYALKNSLKRHVRKHHSSSSSSSSNTEFARHIPENSPVHYKNVGPENGETKSTRKEIATYRLAPNVYLREFSYDRFTLQKESCSVLLCKGELKQIQDISDPVMVCMEEFKEGKQIKFIQNLGKEAFLSVQTPYRCVDIRKFWVVPDTEQLHGTKIGVPLTFSEFKRLLDVLKKNIFTAEEESCSDDNDSGEDQNSDVV